MSDASFFVTERAGDAVIARLRCPVVGEREAGVLGQELASACEPGKGFVLDLSHVTMVSSIGLSMFITLYNQSKASKSKMVMFALSKDLRSLMKVTKLEKLLTIVADEATALRKAT